jgi:hypothetical protein
MIAALQELRESNGGDCPVKLRVFGRELLYAHCSLSATAKNFPYRTVSRGGVPCVLIHE